MAFAKVVFIVAILLAIAIGLYLRVKRFRDRRREGGSRR